jgi:TonB family protein
MYRIKSRLTDGTVRRAAVRLMQAAALSLVVALAIPAHAAGEREIKSRVAPVYPEIAKRLKIVGAVKIEATVDPEGKVTNAKTVSGNRALATAAEDAVRQWRFAPGPATSTSEVELKFALGE